MKLKTIFIAVLFSCLLGSCSKNTALFNIDSYLEMTLILGTPADRVFGYTQEVIFPYTIELSSQNVADEDIVRINSSYGLIYPTFGEQVNLNFINTITVDAVDPDDPDNTKEVFYYEQFNFNEVKEIELFPSLPNIKDFVRDDRLTLEVEFIFNSPPPRTFDLAFELEFGALESE